MNIIVTGSLGFDYIMDFPGVFSDRIMPEAIHKLSLSFLVDTLKKQFGGTAGNIAYTLHLLGEHPHIVAPAGNDFSSYLDFLKTKKIDVTGIEIHTNVPTSSYFVITDKEDNQIGSFFIGAMKYASGLSLRWGGTSRQTTFVVISPNDPKAMVLYAHECTRLHLPYLFDPAFQIATMKEHDLGKSISHAAMLIGNDYEIALIEKRLNISHGKLLGMVPIVITTLGSKGSRIEQRDKKWMIRPVKVKRIVDPTGAGDAYRGGFLAGYFRGFDLPICGQMGSVAAAYTVEKYGTVTHAYTQKEFIKRYKDNFGKTLTL